MTVSEFQKLLQRAPALLARAWDRLLQEEAAATQADAKRRAPKRSGELASSILARVLDDQRIQLSAASPYAAIQEYGGVVHGSPLLTFRGRDGRWRSARSVRIPAHPYLRPAMAAADDRMQERLEQLVLEVLGGE